MRQTPVGSSASQLSQSSSRRHRLRRFSALILAAACAHWGRQAQAATRTWTASSGNWATAGNWSGDAVPKSGDTVDITDDDNTSRTITYNYTGSAITLGNLTVDNDGALGINTLSMTSSGTALAAAYEYVGNSNTSTLQGFGVMTQSLGTNSITNALYLGYGSDDQGTYSLSGTGTLSSDGEVVGSNGTGIFFQSGGTNIIINVGGLSVGGAGATGYYYLSAGTLELTDAAAYEVVGDTGAGSFIQSGGTNSCGILQVASGFFSLSAGSLLVGSGGEYIGYNYLGSFVQSGGTNSDSGELDVGHGDNGVYSLSGAGSLSVAGSEYVGDQGSGTFNQSGGTNIASGLLYLGYPSGSTGIYTLSGTGELTVTGGVYVGGSSSAAAGSGSLNVSGGQMTVGGTLEVWNTSGTQVTISGGSISAGNTVNLATINVTGGSANLGPVTGTGTLNVGGGTPASVTASGLQQSSVNITSNGQLTLTAGGATNAVNSLVIDSGGVFNLTSTKLIINYGANPDPVAAIRGYLVSGYNGGTWTGLGIDSSSAAANPGYALGYADGADGVVAGLSSGQIEVKYTLLGDADLDGSVTGIDFTILASNLGKSVSGWDKGDFNYGGVVNGVDFTELVANLGKSASGADITLPAADYAAIDAFAAANGLMVDVPEPTSFGLLGLAAAGVLARRRRSA